MSKTHTRGIPTAPQTCIDYRKLNFLLLSVTPATSTKKGAKIGELFALIKGAKYFTALDLHSGYYHIKLDEESIPKRAFTTVFGEFEFLRLIFGSPQGPDIFIHLIYNFFRLDKTLDKSQGSGYLAYLNNILIYSKTEKEHLEMLNNAFEYLSIAGLKIKLNKC